MAINNGALPLINKELLKVEDFELDSDIKDKINAYQYSETAPLQAFEQNPQIRGWDLFLENDFRNQLTKVFLGEKKPVIAQAEIKEIISKWLTKKDIIIKGLNDKDVKKKDEKEKEAGSVEDKNAELGKDNKK